MEPFRGKASGKTLAEEGSPRWQLHVAQKRIAELETEKKGLLAELDGIIARAEKAEAEVERLRRICERFDLDLYEQIREEAHP